MWARNEGSARERHPLYPRLRDVHAPRHREGPARRGGRDGPVNDTRRIRGSATFTPHVIAEIQRAGAEGMDS